MVRTLLERSQRSDEDEGYKEETMSQKVGALSCYPLCGRHIRKDGSRDELTAGSRLNETCQDFEKAIGASEGQTRGGRSHRLCV